MKEKLNELVSDNDNRDDWRVEEELWDSKGRELYSNMVEHTYNGKPLWFGMDSKDIAEVKS